MARLGIDDRNKWTVDELKELYRLKKQGKSFREISEFISSGRGPGAYSRKYKRMNWDSFFQNPDVESKPQRKWSDEEMIQLDAFLQAGSSYGFMAEKLNRSVESIESRAKSTDWKVWRSLRKVNIFVDDTDDQVENKKKDLIDQLVNHVLNVCRYDFKRVETISEIDFLNKINLEKGKLLLPFGDLRILAKNKLVSMGFGNPETMELKKGRYIIVGDSHGKHTKKDMFSLLRQVNETLKPDKIIHVGHILDDDNDISYDWGSFKNLVILAKVEELKTIQEQRNKYDFSYDIVRENITIGDMVITNQDIISDYVRTPISNLDTEILFKKTVVNCHRLEFSTRCCNDGSSYVASPGCLCENHVVMTIKQIDYQDGRIVKQAFHEGFIKYRRMGQFNKYWERGLLVIEANKQCDFTVVPCSIKKINHGFATSYFDKIITSKGVFAPDKKIIVTGDMHCDLHDVNVLDIQEQICKDYKPHAHVNVGDTMNYTCLNHHIMDRGGVIIDKTIVDEAAQTFFVLQRVKKWARESYLIYGNHERFAKDFVEKFPQFRGYLDFTFVCNLEGIGYNLIPIKSVLKLGKAKFIHGEIKMFGQTGNKLEKASRTFGGDIFIGHIHRPEIRFGCFSVGLTGLLDHEYNEPESSNWMHGFGMCNQWRGINWMTTIGIVNNSCILNGKTYNPSNVNSWHAGNYSASIVYKFNNGSGSCEVEK